MTMQGHYLAMARYNWWANARILEDIGELTDEQQNRDVGIYFGSAVSTLSHVLNTDRAWSFILQGGTLTEMCLPPLPTDFVGLRAARQNEDKLLVAWMERITESWLNQPFSFTSGLGTFSGRTFNGTHSNALSHVFNHQTHHRGQVHAALTRLGINEPRALDLLVKGFGERAPIDA